MTTSAYTPKSTTSVDVTLSRPFERQTERRLAGLAKGPCVILKAA